MSSENSLRGLLLADAAVAALVGQRIKADRAEAGTVIPFVVFARSSTDPIVTLEGVLLAERVFFEIECWAHDRAQADAIADACADAIRGQGQDVSNRSATSDPELDLQASILSVEWFEPT